MGTEANPEIFRGGGKFFGGFEFFFLKTLAN